MSGKLSKEDFVERATKIHGERYDYSKSIYINNHTKVEIICRSHGSFYQKPSMHMFGYGCLKCKINNSTKSLEKFQCQANLVHGGKYDYSKVNYINGRTKIEIICRLHGSFWQEPSDHLKGRGCFACFVKKQTLSHEEFTTRSVVIHNGKYTYPQPYVKSNIPINITCPIHGNFSQTPASHLQGSGCPKCGVISQTQTRSGTLEYFIQKANTKHNNKYDYSNVEYINNLTKVEIICPKHGSFWQLAATHMHQSGCSKCSSNISHMETEWLDSHNIPEEYRQKYMKINGKRIIADAYDPNTNTIYEFYGDYWHGNPKIYNPDDINHASKKTFKILYEETLAREKLIKDAGYNLVSIWESDFIGT